MTRDDTNVAKEVTANPLKVARKAQTEVDGQSGLLFETTPARPKARTEPRNMEKGSHGDRPRTGIRSAKVSKGEQYYYY